MGLDALDLDRMKQVRAGGLGGGGPVSRLRTSSIQWVSYLTATKAGT